MWLEEEKYLKEIEKLIKHEIEKETAVVPHAARSSRAPRGEHHERSHAPKTGSPPGSREFEKSIPPRPAAPKKPSHDPWFDKPYEPSGDTAAFSQPDRPASKPKGQVAALLVRRRG